MRKGGVYLAIGDSISWTIPSEVDAPGRNLYSYRLWHAINKDYAPIRHINRGYGGSHSHDLLDRLHIFALGVPYDLVTIQIGMNDMMDTVENFQSDVETIIDKLKTYRPNCEIVLCGIPPVDPVTQANRHEKRPTFNAKLNEIATNNEGVYFADFSSAYDLTRIPDGIHPDSDGHRLLFEILYPVVQTTNFVSRLS
ncbi:SGNH/GDSL hydrolase family protein [Fredinandcohnia sp. 179-A 10B2 NHS]|uniref:SGNH/GDSL hydrolase family protein n=1 Tax=Fredinandcohnia sp. 179-A 10B2 NHS TaxID=3235176 RepID=UPI0039A251F9